MSAHQNDVLSEQLRSQLFRYAQDLQALMAQHSTLQQRYQVLLQSQGRARLGENLLATSLRHGSDHPYLLTNSAGTIIKVSPAAENLLGESGLDLLGLSIVHAAPVDQRERLSALLTLLASGPFDAAIWQCQMTLVDRVAADSSSAFDVLVMPTENANRMEIYWLLHPHTATLTDELQVLCSFELLQSDEQGLFITDAGGIITATNSAFTSITGYTPTEAIGQKPRMLAADRHDAAFYQTFWHDLLKTGHWSGEFFNRRKSGHIYPEWKTVKAVKNSAGQTLAYLAIFADISNQPDNTDQLSRLAYHDTLTGLPNRRLLEKQLTQALLQAKRDDIGLSLFFIDLDRFKPINDELGHDVGDLVLQTIGLRLKKAIRRGDMAARVGGDEFVILLQSAVRSKDVETIANNVLAALSEPIIIGGNQLLVGASIGCARYPMDGSDIDTLLKHADTAMYTAKHLGGNHFCFFKPDAARSALPNLGLDLWRALDRREMHLLYQPQVSALGQLKGCEALLRWTHPTLGDISPLTFIPIAEINGAILSLGDWVLTTACRQLRLWHDSDLPGLTMAVNVSSRQLRDPGFAQRVCQILQDTGVPPHALELEITESEALQHQVDGDLRLQPLRDLGVKIAIDDFGTGYSSLSRLQTLPVDRLKIDQGFVRNLANDHNARAISQCFVSMGLAMGMEVVAEGVETAEQLQVLSGQGCHLIQGYFISRPMAAEALLAWVKSKSFQTAHALS